MRAPAGHGERASAEAGGPCQTRGVHRRVLLLLVLSLARPLVAGDLAAAVADGLRAARETGRLAGLLAPQGLARRRTLWRPSWS